MEYQALRSVPWALLSYALTKCIAFGTTLVLARLLVPSEFGIIALAAIATNFLFWFGDLGFAGTLVVRQDLDRRALGTVLTLMLASASLVAVVAAALSPVAASVFREPRLASVLAILSLSLAMGGVTGFFEALLQRELEFRRRFVALLTQSATNALVSISCAVAGAGVWSLVAGQLASVAAFAAVLVALAPHRPRPRFDRAVARDVFVTGRGFLTQGATQFVRQNFDSALVGRSLGAASIGFYSMAFKLGDLTYSALADPIIRVTTPSFARSRARGEDFRPSYLASLRLVALAVVPAGVILSGAAAPFTRAVYGPRWVDMTAPLAVVGLWAAVRPVDAMLAWVLNAVGRAGSVGWVSVVILVPLVPTLLLAAATGRLWVIAMVPLLDTLLSLWIQARLVRRHVELPLRRQWKAVGPIVLASPMGWVAAYLAGHAVGDQLPLLGLALAVLAGAAAYLAQLSALEPGLLRGAAGQVTRTLRRRAALTPT